MKANSIVHWDLTCLSLLCEHAILFGFFDPFPCRPFIQELSLRNYLGEERFAFCQTPFYLGWCANNKIDRKWRGQPPTNSDSLLVLITRWHHDEQVDITVIMGRAVGV